MAKRKSPQNNTAATPKATFVFEEYRDAYTASTKMACIDKLTNEMPEWFIANPKARSIEKFCVIKGISPKYLQRWCEKYPQFKEAYEFCLMLIGQRIEEYMYDKIQPEKSAMYVLPHYLERWKSTTEYHASLRTDESANKTVIKEIIHVHDPLLEIGK